jgi:hypothetical protein
MEPRPIGLDLLRKPWTPFRMRLPDRRTPNSDIYLNSRYQVHLERHSSEKEGMPDLVHLSFRRLDYQTLVPYEDKLRIKDELVHPECEGIELYTARSREVDMANQYHLWVIESPSFRFPVSTNFRLRTTTPFETVNDPDLLKRSWTPLLPCEEVESGVLYRNSRYQVFLRRFPLQEHEPDAVYLFLQRLDRSSLIPYRDRMRIKDELIHPECEGIELLPARSRAILPMEGCALWVIDDQAFRMSFGFPQRFVSDISLDGAVQEPWPIGERPSDCLSEAELRKLMRSEEGYG